MKIIASLILLNGLICSLCGGLENGNDRGGGNLRNDQSALQMIEATFPGSIATEQQTQDIPWSGQIVYRAVDEEEEDDEDMIQEGKLPLEASQEIIQEDPPSDSDESTVEENVETPEDITKKDPPVEKRVQKAITHGPSYDNYLMDIKFVTKDIGSKEEGTGKKVTEDQVLKRGLTMERTLTNVTPMKLPEKREKKLELPGGLPPPPPPVLSGLTGVLQTSLFNPEVAEFVPHPEVLPPMDSDVLEGTSWRDTKSDPLEGTSKGPKFAIANLLGLPEDELMEELDRLQVWDRPDTPKEAEEVPDFALGDVEVLPKEEEADIQRPKPERITAEELEEAYPDILKLEKTVKSAQPKLPRVSADFSQRCATVDSLFFNVEKLVCSSLTHYEITPRDEFRFYKVSFGNSLVWRSKYTSEKCLHARISFLRDNKLPEEIRLYLVIESELVLYIFKFWSGQWIVEKKEHLDGLRFKGFTAVSDYTEDPKYQDEEPEFDDLLIKKGRDYPVMEPHVAEIVAGYNGGIFTVMRVIGNRESLISKFLESC